ncbi:MAG: hypothetical protein R3F22_09010 [Lysobacteraceae bacterium]
MSGMGAENMTLARFEEQLDRNGSQLANWPEGERRAAEAILLASPLARAAYAQAEALEQRLAACEAPEPSPALRRRLLADFDAQRSRRTWLATLWQQIGGTRIAVPAMTAALALGVAVGSWLPPTAGDDVDGGDEDALLLLQYDLDIDGEW